jgi:ABC-type branched-subunit amino acid transport system substrate-binding protein
MALCGFRPALAAAVVAALGLLALPARAEQGVSQDEVLIGVVTDLSGPGAPIGTPMDRGMNVGVLIINDKGGINGRKLRLLTEDSGFDARRAILATRKLLLQSKVFAFVGNMGTAIVKATIPMVTEQGRPYLFPTALDPAFTDPPQHLVATILPDYSITFGVATNWAADTLGKKRFCLLYSDGDSGEQSRAGMQRVLAARGLAPLVTATFKTGAFDLGSQVATLKAADCDALMFNGIVRDAATALLERQKLGWKVDTFVSQAATGVGLLDLAKEAADGVYGIQTSVPVMLMVDNPRVAEFVERYKTENGRPPDEGAFMGFQQVLLFSEVAKRAGPDLTADSFMTALDGLAGFDMGIGTAPLTFTEQQRLGAHQVVMIHVQAGHWEQLAVVR